MHAQARAEDAADHSAILLNGVPGAIQSTEGMTAEYYAFAIFGVRPPMTVQAFCDWLSNTPVSLKIQTILWIIPAVQTVHILCVSLVLSSMAMLDLRLMGLAARRQPVSRMIGRFVPWVWRGLAVLATTGAILITGEPERELLNPVLATVIVITLIVQRLSRKNDTYWETRKVAARLAGFVSLLLWIGIVSAGRWIAYV
jgi:hypothetical protein